MDANLTRLIESLAQRPYSSGGHVQVASQALAGIVKCFGDPTCAARATQLGTPSDWEKCLKEASSRLVYHDDDMTVTGGKLAGGPSNPGATPRDFGVGKDLPATPGACLDFECVLTSTRPDRDRDVLHSDGASLDEKMPVLWMHFHMVPVGKYVSLRGRDARQVRTHGAIIDNAFGNDVAQMVEFGCLRISHGFIPKDWDLRDKQDKDEPEWMQGLDIKKFEVVEKSLVSVPSNVDAEITLFSRGKLHSPPAKALAQAHYDARVKIVKSGWVTPSPSPAPAPVPVPVPVPMPAATGHSCSTSCGEDGVCLCGVTGELTAEGMKALGEMVDVALDDALSSKPYPNEHACRISDPKKYDKFRRQNKEDKKGRKYGMIFGQVKGKDSWELQAMRFAKADWSAAEARTACKAASGSFEPAATTHEPEGTKQRLSQRNASKLKQVHAMIGEIHDKVDAKGDMTSACVMCKHCQGLLGEVMSDGEANASSPDETSAQSLAVKLAAALMKGADIGPGFRLALREALDLADDRALLGELAAMA